MLAFCPGGEGWVDCGSQGVPLLPHQIPLFLVSLCLPPLPFQPPLSSLLQRGSLSQPASLRLPPLASGFWGNLANGRHGQETGQG